MKFSYYILTLILILGLISSSYARINKSNDLIVSQYYVQDTVNTDTNKDEEYKNTDSNPIPDGIQQKCSDFFNSLMKETVSEAYNNLFRGSPISRNQDKIRNLVVSSSKAIEIYGKIFGFEPVGIKAMSPSYYKVKYFSLHSLNPIEWTMTFYKSPTIGWIVLNFKFSDTF